MSISENITQIIANINNTSNNVKLVAVTKNHPAAAMNEAIMAGVTAIAENRVQEASEKFPQLLKPVECHLIGHLQTNKANKAVQLFDLIHSVDSERLAIEIDKIAGKIGKRQDVLLQVNVVNEETKFGVSPKEVMKLGQLLNNLENVRLCGLMTIAPFYQNTEMVRPVFREMYQLFRELRALNLPNTNIQWLSMGMTHDYLIAIEEGANLVRIGTGIFGQRVY